VIFHWLNPSVRSAILGSTQPLTEMSTKAGKGGWCYGWQPYHLPVPTVQKLWKSHPPAALRGCTGLLNLYLYLNISQGLDM